MAKKKQKPTPKRATAKKATKKPAAKAAPVTKAPVVPDLPGPHGRAPVCYCQNHGATGEAHQHDEHGITYVKVSPNDRGY